MIQNLNKFSFAAFGRVLPESVQERGFPQESEWTHEHITYSAGPVRVYRAESMQTYLDIERGTTMLAVAREGEELEYFYLDKPVCIHPGILFAIIPRGSCTIVRAIHARGGWTALHMLDADKLPRNIMRQIEIGGIYTLFYQEKEKGFFFKGEEHDLFELVYVDKGALHNVVNGTDTVLRQGEMMVYSPGLWHMQHADLDMEVSFITVSFELQSNNLDPLVNRRLGLDADETALLRRMLVEQDQNDPYSGDLIVCLLQQLLLSILRIGDKVETRLKTPATLQNENSIVNAALTYISANARQKLPVPLVARSCNVSVSRLTKLFQERLSITPGEYIRRVKLEESKALIKAGEGNVSQIAELLQYSTVQHFSRQFKAKFGVTPSEFAKSVR